MYTFSNLFAVYTPVYIYTALVLYFVAYLALSTPKNSPNTLQAFFSANRRWVHNLTFFSTILAMLGTPPTVGFFGKLLTFYLLSQRGGVSLLAVVVFTLLLLIFYLQSLRAKAHPKRRLTYRHAGLTLGFTTFLLYGQLFLIGFAAFLPAIIDILASALL